MPKGFSRHVCASVSGLFSFAHLCGVEVWRSGLGGAYLLPTTFVSRCLTSSAMLPFPHPAHRTGRADLPHPALGEDSRNRRDHCK